MMGRELESARLDRIRLGGGVLPINANERKFQLDSV